MIILDEEPSKHDIVAGTTTVRFPDTATVSSRPSSILPDYETSQALNLHSFNKPRLRSRRFGRFWTDSKFWRGTLYALAIYVALTVAIGVPLIVTQTQKSYPPPQQPPQVRVAWDGQNLQPDNLDMGSLLAMDNDACNNWTSYNDDATNSDFSAFLAHSFPLSANESFIIQSNLSCDSPGPLGVRGNLTFNYNTDPSVPTTSLNLSLRSTSLELRKRTFICFTGIGSNRSLSIYVPDNFPTNDSLSISVNILFPHPKHTVTYCDLATYLPFFSHHFGDLSNTTFSSFAVQGAQSDLTFDSINADRLSVKNNFAAITGKFGVTSSLNLDNIEGPVSTNVTMDQQSDQPPPIFQMSTGNGPLRTNILLVSTSEYAGYAPFVGQIQNFNAPIILDVSYSSSTPSGTWLGLSIFNSQADTNITMDPKWSGSFDMQTKLATVQVLQGKSGARDPSGKNLQWIVSYISKTASRLQGWVGWGPMPSNAALLQSHLQVVSSLEPVVLHLGADPS